MYTAAQGDAGEWARLLIVACARWGQKRIPESDAALAELTANDSETAAYQIAEGYAYRNDKNRAFERVGAAPPATRPRFGQFAERSAPDKPAGRSALERIPAQDGPGRRSAEMSPAEQRKLSAIMFTDMVGYSALSQRDDKLALELLEEHRHLLREIFPRFNGTEIKTIGDAFLIEFNSALEAAQCAIEIQRTLAKRNHDVTVDRRIELKIGIHIGDVVHRGGDVYGDGVNIASRIESLAGAGGICVSMDVERQIRNALEARFEKLAPTEFKNISVPMDLFRIVLPWEQRSAVVTKSEARSRPSGRKFATAGIALLLLLIIGIG